MSGRDRIASPGDVSMRVGFCLLAVGAKVVRDGYRRDRRAAA